MNIHKWFSRFFLGSLADEIELLDHCPVETSAPDWRDARVIQAAQRFGKPFKCAGPSVPREVWLTSKSEHMVLIKGGIES